MACQESSLSEAQILEPAGIFDTSSPGTVILSADAGATQVIPGKLVEGATLNMATEFLGSPDTVQETTRDEPPTTLMAGGSISSR